MHNKLKIVGLLVFGLIFMGAGCAKADKESAQKQALRDITPSEEYVWKEQSLSFKYKKGLFVIPNGENSLYINVDSEVIPDDASSGLYPRLDALPNISLDRVIEIYKKNNPGWKSQSTEKVGNYTFTKIQYEDAFVGEIRTHYLYTGEDRVFDYRTGLGTHEDSILLIVSSIQF